MGKGQEMLRAVIRVEYLSLTLHSHCIEKQVGDNLFGGLMEQASAFKDTQVTR